MEQTVKEILDTIDYYHLTFQPVYMGYNSEFKYWKRFPINEPPDEKINVFFDTIFFWKSLNEIKFLYNALSGTRELYTVFLQYPVTNFWEESPNSWVKNYYDLDSRISSYYDRKIIF